MLYAFRCEMAQTLSDALLRRTMVGMGPNVALDADEAVAEIAATTSGATSPNSSGGTNPPANKKKSKNRS